MKFTLYASNCIGIAKNCYYQKKIEVVDEASLVRAVSYDHVTALYKDGYRAKSNFVKADNIPMDCDNDHSEKPAEWITSEDVKKAFDGIPFAIVYSRNHLKAKGDKSPRPRFHVYFPVPVISDVDEYTDMKQKIARVFPYFDNNALDSARFLYGTEEPKVELHEGDTFVTDYIEALSFASFDKGLKEIPEGSRNSTMSHIAGKLIKRYGNNDAAYELFLKESEKCNPPLEETELKTIWNSAINFGEKVSSQKDYVPPEIYNSSFKFKPTDYSDVGQALVLSKAYEDLLRYSPQTDYIVYNDSFWEESRPKSQGVAQLLTEMQMEEAQKEIKKAMQEMSKNGALALLATMGPKKAVGMFTKEQARTYERYEAANTYLAYTIKRRESKNITACLREARPMLEIEQKNLDENEFLLNAPLATYDLRTGKAKEHSFEDFITKQTAVEPDNVGDQLWHDALQTFFCGDAELISYVQMIVGLSAIGKVYVEALIIAYGEGRNGKSTFWNVVARVLGSYSGNISADMLTVGCKRNVKPELAEAKGKRLLIAAELEEGMRLNTSNVKQLCSTDEIYAEKKYKDPFSYIPTHTLVLYTNHLPRVGALDAGTWRRLIVIPFDAKIEGTADIKNYADYLFEKAGGAILTWIIEGAKKVIAAGYKVSEPTKVKAAISAYKENNDWFGHFLDDCCELDLSFQEKSGEVYTSYRNYCSQNGEFTRGASDFYAAVDASGLERRKMKKGVMIRGLRLKSEFLDD